MFSNVQLQKRRQALGLSQAAVARELGISRSAYHNWESGKTQPNQKNLQMLSEILQVSLTYFEAEHPIVDIYLQLNEGNQHKVLTYAQTKLVDQQQAQDKSKVFAYKVYEKLSAGTGHTVFEDQNYDTVYFDQEIDYDIASWIYGDSMEPKYLNGSVALIKETGFDYDGAIYAIVWDGQTYLKKVYREKEGLRLVSLNKKYADKLAPYEEDPRIVGKLVGNFMPMEL
ncbi:TPA: S24 family peptidase [Streptococcus suis]